MEDLKRHLINDLFDLYSQIKSNAKVAGKSYNPAQYLRKISQPDGIQGARELLENIEIDQGLKTLDSVGKLK